MSHRLWFRTSSRTPTAPFSFSFSFGSWASSDIFTDDMFGQAMGSAENGYQLTKGRFGGIASIYDPDGTLVDIDCHHNAYGYLGPTHNYQVTRQDRQRGSRFVVAAVWCVLIGR